MKKPAVDLSELDPDLRAQLERRLGKRARARRNDFPKDAVRRHAFRCMAVLADLSQANRRRVLAQAVKLNNL